MSSQNPFRKAEDAQLQYDMDIFIDEMGESSGVGGGVANFLTGYAIDKGGKFPFEAVAYGRIGGQNVSPILQPEAIKRLEELNVDLALFTAGLKWKIAEGNMPLNISQGDTCPEKPFTNTIRPGRY